MKDSINTKCLPTYRLLNEEQIKEIHRATLEILETVGVRVRHEEGIQLFKTDRVQAAKPYLSWCKILGYPKSKLLAGRGTLPTLRNQI